MGSECVLTRTWKGVLCHCGHAADRHATSETSTGCMAIEQRTVTTQPIEPPGHPNRGLPTTRTLFDECRCMHTREEVIFEALQSTIAEICEHQEQRRTRRADVR